VELDPMLGLVGFFCLSSLLSLLGLGGIWLVLRANWKSTPGIEIKRDTVIDRRVKTDTPTATLLCEKCQRPLGRWVPTCSEQATRRCPYQVEQTPGHGTTGLNWGCLFIGVTIALAGVALSWKWFPVSLCLLALGLLGAAAGVYGMGGSGLKVYNKTTGQIWQRHGLPGLTLTKFTASALQPVVPAIALPDTLKYPASICTLYRDENGHKVFYMALLSLLIQEAIKLQYTTTSRTFFGLSLVVRREFILSLGGNLMPSGANGELEKRIVDAVKAWSDRPEQHIRFNRRNFRTRMFSHFLTLDDLVFIVFEGERHGSPARLVLDLVEEDADRQGLGRLEGGWRRRFETVPEYQDSMLAEYGVIRKVHETLTASQPDIFSTLALAVERAINLLETDWD
jgi:hypothetical protein